MFMGLGGPELLVILIIVLLLFGAKKIPELMHGAGQGVKAFKDGMREAQDAVSLEEKKDDAEAGNTQGK
jgi:sec-independent protein translocase protein TatA